MFISMMKLKSPVLTVCILISNIIRTFLPTSRATQCQRYKSEKIVLIFKLLIKKLIQLLEELGLGLLKQ